MKRIERLKELLAAQAEANEELISFLVNEIQHPRIISYAGGRRGGEPITSQYATNFAIRLIRQHELLEGEVSSKQ